MASVEDALSRGAELFARREFVLAAEAYSEVIRKDPLNFKALSNRSACHAKMEKYDDALTDAEQAISLDPTFSKAFGRKAAALQGLLRYEEAVAAYNAALLLDPTNTLYTAGRTELEGLIAQRRGIASKETKDKFYFDKSVREGKEAMTRGELHEAVRHFSKAIQLCPESDVRDRATLLSNRSAAWFRLEKYREATTDALEASRVDGLYPRGFLRLAMSQHREGKLDEARKSIEEALRLDPENTMAKEEMQSIEASIAQRDKSTAAHLSEQQCKVAALATERTQEAGDMRRQGGPAYATAFAYCSLCNSHGHDRSECPIMIRKRRRD